MYISDISRTDILSSFDPVSLHTLIARAAMLERLDQKYVVDRPVLDRALMNMRGAFSALEIQGTRSFEYRTVYFDSFDRRSYHDHHQGRRRRAKVRVRHYVDAGSTFAEVKLKDRRGITVKQRLPLETDNLFHLTDQAIDFVHQSYRDLYAKEFAYELRPVLAVVYKRITLVANAGGERMTIDSALSFSAGEKDVAVSPDIFIVETKSANGNGLADKVFRALHQHPMEHCSKYCVGTALLHEDVKSNRFRPAIKKLTKM